MLVHIHTHIYIQLSLVLHKFAIEKDRDLHMQAVSRVSCAIIIFNVYYDAPVCVHLYVSVGGMFSFQTIGNLYACRTDSRTYGQTADRSRWPPVYLLCARLSHDRRTDARQNMTDVRLLSTRERTRNKNALPVSFPLRPCLSSQNSTNAPAAGYVVTACCRCLSVILNPIGGAGKKQSDVPPIPFEI